MPNSPYRRADPKRSKSAKRASMARSQARTLKRHQRHTAH